VIEHLSSTRHKVQSPALERKRSRREKRRKEKKKKELTGKEQ
jgi:hypothetical protein